MFAIVLCTGPMAVADADRGLWTRPEPPSAAQKSPAKPMRPTAVTADPFAEIVRQEKPKKTKKGRSNSPQGIAYGSIPQIRDDEQSVDFIIKILTAVAQADALEKGLTPRTTQELEKSYRDYARQLVKTLSQLTFEQQRLIFYGE